MHNYIPMVDKDNDPPHASRHTYTHTYVWCVPLANWVIWFWAIHSFSRWLWLLFIIVIACSVTKKNIYTSQSIFTAIGLNMDITVEWTRGRLNVLSSLLEYFKVYKKWLAAKRFLSAMPEIFFTNRFPESTFWSVTKLSWCIFIRNSNEMSCDKKCQSKSV